MNYLRKLLPAKGHVSYAQSGEDLIVDSVFRGLNKPTPSYLDIGAHHPTYISNTYFFYASGSHGVCVEPDPILSANIRSKRPRDTVLNIGVAEQDYTTAEFYVMSARSLSTFSKADAQRYESYGNQKIEQTLQIPCLSVNTIMKQHFPNSVDFVSIDIEGKDLEVLEAFDFTAYRPSVFCLETLTYAEDNAERKLTEIIDFMTARNYFAYGDTYINTIFVDRSAWENR